MYMPTVRRLFAVLLVSVFAFQAFADDREGPGNIVGTWLVSVSFPPGVPVPPFKELITFHAGGTVTEANTTLHENSATPGPFNFNGSDGQGTWQRERDGIAITLHKLVFHGAESATPNQHAGYFRIFYVLRRGPNGTLVANAAGGSSDLILGPDPRAPFTVIPFGGADAIATRLR